MTVVSSIAPDGLDESRLREGGVALRDLLVAASGGVREAHAADAVTSDPLMNELAGRLRREGLVVGERVGTGPHRVELAVTVPDHPERWLLAVDGDGPAYATWRGTRERDRLWPQELERRGWRHLRVWSTDLYRDPARDVARIVTAVREEARALGSLPSDGVAQEGEPAPSSAEPTGDELNAEVDSDESAATRRPKAKAGRRRRRASRQGTEGSADVAGQTTDDTDTGWGERRDEGAHEEWLQDQRPPHWD
jgi:hypothetical protein